MDEMTEWSESDKTLYIAVVPILALIGALLLLSVATSSSRHASAASGVAPKVDMSTLAIAERVRDEAIATRRKLYAGCYADMGLQTGAAARLVHPEKEKRALAGDVCKAVVENSVLRLPAPKNTLVPASS